MGARFQEKPSGFTQFLPTHVCFFIPIPPMFLYLKNKSWQDRALLSLSFSWTSVAPAGRSALPHTSSQAHRQAHTFTVQAIPSAPKSSPLSPHIKPFLFISRFTEHQLPSLSISFLQTSPSYSPSLPSAATSISPNIWPLFIAPLRALSDWYYFINSLYSSLFLAFFSLWLWAVWEGPLMFLCCNTTSNKSNNYCTV